MGCSATKTVPQERSTPSKGHPNGEIIKNQKKSSERKRSSQLSEENVRQSPDKHSSHNGSQLADSQPVSQTGGQTSGHIGKSHHTGSHTVSETGTKASDQTHEHSKDKGKKKAPAEISLSKDLGLRKLQRKETPQAGPLALNNKAISQSQTEFFKLLDEKIEKGGGFEEEEEVT